MCIQIVCSVLAFFGLLFFIVGAVLSYNKTVFCLIFLGMIFVFLSNSIMKRVNEGNPAPSLKFLITGEKYEVMDIYEKYIIIKSTTDNGKLKFLGPLDFGTRTITTGKYVKTAEESLEKIE